MYPSKDGKLFATKQQRDVHNASLTYDDVDYIISTPFSATRDMNEHTQWRCISNTHTGALIEP